METRPNFHSRSNIALDHVADLPVFCCVGLGYPHALCDLRHDGAVAGCDTFCLIVHYAVFVSVLLVMFAEVLDAFLFACWTWSQRSWRISLAMYPSRVSLCLQVPCPAACATRSWAWGVPQEPLLRHLLHGLCSLLHGHAVR